MEQISRIWEETLKLIEEEVSTVSFETWIQPIIPCGIEGDRLYLQVENEFYREMLEKRNLTLIRNAVKQAAHREYEIVILTEEEKFSKPVPTEQKTENNLVRNLNPKYVFDSFVVGNSNRMAHAASLAVAEAPAQAYNPLFLYGNSGLGKTHLMHSIAHFILDKKPDAKVLYVTSETFTNELINSIQNNKNEEFRNKYRNIDVLLIDDIQFIIGKESTQEEFFHTFNVLHSASKQIVLSSDKPPKEMETLEERFRSRFEWGLIADIQSPDYETKVAILLKNAENYEKKINNAIFEYIANNIQSNIRELEGAFNKIIAFSKINKIPLDELTMAHAEDALKDVIYPSKTKEITTDLILNIVAEHFEVTAEDIKSQRRNVEFVIPRQVYMYLCRELIETPLTNIAKTLGKKDHTTIIHGIKKIEEEMKFNEELKNKINIIKNILSSS